MAFGIGTRGDVSFGPDGSDTWGGPMNGVDVTAHDGNARAVNTAWHANLSVDTYLFLLMMGALALLWLLGGVAFKNARL